MERDSVSCRDYEVMMESVICGIHQHGVVDQRKDDDGRWQDFTVKDILVTQLQISGIQPYL